MWFVLFCLLAIVVVGAYQYDRKKKRKQDVPAASATPTPTAAPAPAEVSFAGRFVGEIINRGGRWGDGTHPDEKKGTAKSRHDYAEGQIWGLGGSFVLVRDAIGAIKVEGDIWGRPFVVNDVVPGNARAVGSMTAKPPTTKEGEEVAAGANIEFHWSADGSTITGTCHEGSDVNKRGDVVARRV